MQENLHYYPQCGSGRTIQWFDEACKEKLTTFQALKSLKQRYTILPKRYYSSVSELTKQKIYDFCFVGSYLIQPIVIKNRSWIIDFINSRFTGNSYLCFTDLKSKKQLNNMGVFDYTDKNSYNYVPKETKDNKNYIDLSFYKILCKSKFALCPAGDSFWSMRFYEALMCESIPIISKKDESFRTMEESLLDYKYYFTNDSDIIYRQDWVDHNYSLFLKYHTLEDYIEHFYTKIQGWFTFQKLYTEMVNKYDNATFVEVGSWLGRSAAYMAVEINNNKKNIKFVCVDTWEGSEEHKKSGLTQNKNLYDEFLNNIRPVQNIILPYKMSSVEAASKFSEDSIDFVFIDASHDYESVKNDLNAWFPKIKNNGTIAGHDYSAYWPGVKKAVDEFFSEKGKFIISDNCWIFKKADIN